ncbi:hypothetical protein [Azohydromonas caseinilytica]|uniref:Phasin protein n=1 Tax=Azohydromonas caseinilytica TaxID=2728836 RepID=A0A848FJ49_9BURK|nr:hypothetical protein [Azohydromonas caseinilytica]NML18263.1 hypothetical protein [Azohydromonas caseinilytica]
MPTDAFETLLAPYSKLARANMELFARFSSSPEILNQTLGTAQKLATEGRDPNAGLPGANAYMDFVMGLVKNWLDFWTDLGQSALGLMDQGQDLFKKAPGFAADAARAVTDIQPKPPRTRPAAA